jgi:hypothetical protein
MIPKLPEKDLKLINDSFKQDSGVETLIKNADGKLVKAVKKVSNEKTVELDYFAGKTLKHQKSVVLPDGQKVVGVKGQKYEDIPEKLRSLVSWDKSDFI